MTIERDGERYEAHRRRVAAAESERSRAGREIGALPKIAGKKRRANCERNFRKFLEVYFPQAFPLKWSADHLRVISRIQQAVLDGGLFAVAMPRGTGKTTLCERAVIWAVLFGHHRYAMLICADEGKAESSLQKIQTELESNEQLAADFPEVCVPIRKLERIANRAKGQTYQGQPTRIEWGKKRVVLPTIAGSQASGAVIGVGGITSAVRGAAYVTPEGQVLRPSIALIDDPQTRESASSALQNHTREQIVAADILGLAGPGQPFAALMPCTVIRKGDMADRLLDRTLHPDWQGERCKLLYSFPTNMQLWEEYRELRADSLRNDGDGKTATQFYRKNRKQMDAGAVVAWEQRHRPDELSAIQHAMNLFFRDAEAFYSEYQNEPLDTDPESETPRLSADDIAIKINGLERRRVPVEAAHLTAFVDVQQSLLYYAVVAWARDFTGCVIDYGSWPDQGRHYWSLSDARPTLQQKFPRAGLEGAIFGGLKALTEEICGREWEQEGGAVVRIDRCFVDANWGESTDVVYQFCRESQYSAILLPSHGKFVGASSVPFSDYKKRRGERLGHHWRIPNVVGKRAIRHVLIDTNYWKSFIHARLTVAHGDRGSLSLWNAKPHVHRMFAEHLTAEYSVQVEARGRVVDEWKARPGRDNHLFDCLVGCAAAASMQGCDLLGIGTGGGSPVRRKRERVKLSDLRRSK